MRTHVHRWGGVVVRLQSGRRRTLGTVLYAIVLLLAATTLAAGLSMRASVGQRWDAVTKRIDTPNLVVTARTSEALGRVGGLDGVSSSGWRVQTLHQTVLVSPLDQRENDINLRMVVKDGPQIGVVVDGRWLRRDESDAVVLDVSLARKLHIVSGQKIILRRPQHELAVTVVGIAIDVTNCLDCAPHNVWSTMRVQSALGKPTWNTFVEGFKVASSRRAADVAREAFVVNGPDVRIATTDQEVRDLVVLGNGLLGRVISGFGLFALVAATIIVASTTSVRLAQLQRDLGLLQVVGATGRSIATLVFLQNSVIALLAGIGGWLMAQSQRNRLVLGPASILPGDDRSNIRELIIVVVVVVSVVALSTIGPVMRTLRLEPVDALRRRPVRRSQRQSLIGGIVPNSTMRLAVRTIVTQRRHVLVALAALMVTSTAAVAASGYNSAIDVFASGSESLGTKSDLRISPGTPEQAQRLDDELRHDPTVEAWWSETHRAVLVEGITSHARFVDGPMDGLKFAVIEGRLPTRAGEAAIGYGLAAATKSHVGQELTVTAEDRVFTVNIVGRVVDGSNAGRSIEMSMADLAVNDRFNVVRAIRFVPGTDVSAAQRRLWPNAAVRDVAIKSDANSIRAKPYRQALFLLALLVLAVGLAQLGSSLVLMIRGLARDIATLRTVGASDAMIISSHIIVSLFLAVTATLLSLPIGWLTYRWSIDRLATQIGIGPGLRLPSPVVGHLVPSAFLVAASVSMATLVVRKHLTRTIASALRAE
jgi:putative ABC transport system permease protein